MLLASMIQTSEGAEWNTTIMLWSAVDWLEKTWQAQETLTGINPCFGQFQYYVTLLGVVRAPEFSELSGKLTKSRGISKLY